MRGLRYSLACASIACVSIVTGCAKSDTVAAAVSLTLSRNPMPIGGPGRPDLFESPQQVSVVQRDRILQHFVVTSGAPTDYDLPLSGEDLGDDEEARLTLKIDKTFVPAHIPGGGGDTRVPGIRVFNAFFEPRSAR